MKGFTENEISLLITKAKEGKAQGKKLTKVFREFGEKTGRASGSVRNFYYALLKTEQGLSSGLNAKESKPFSTGESERIIRDILTGCAYGKSVRQTIYEMAGGNEKQALRLQNKYRNLIAKERQVVENVKADLSLKKVPFKDPYAEKALKKGFLYHRLEGEIDRLFEKIALKEKRINGDLLERIKTLESENKRLKEKSKIEIYYGKGDKKDGEKRV